MAREEFDYPYFIELCSAAIDLQAAAKSLKRLAEGLGLDEEESGRIEWTGDLIGQMDWESEHYRNREHLELFEIAVQLSPLFYRKVSMSEMRLSRNLKAQLEKAYATFKSCGKERKISDAEIGIMAGVFQSMADDIFNGNYNYKV